MGFQDHQEISFQATNVEVSYLFRHQVVAIGRGRWSVHQKKGWKSGILN